MLEKMRKGLTSDDFNLGRLCRTSGRSPVRFRGLDSFQSEEDPQR